MQCNRNRNRNLKISKALLKSQAHQGTSLFTSAAANQRRGFPKGDQEKLRSDFQNTRRVFALSSPFASTIACPFVLACHLCNWPPFTVFCSLQCALLAKCQNSII